MYVCVYVHVRQRERERKRKKEKKEERKKERKTENKYITTNAQYCNIFPTNKGLLVKERQRIK